jgi:hypothetical protein
MKAFLLYYRFSQIESPCWSPSHLSDLQRKIVLHLMSESSNSEAFLESWLDDVSEAAHNER